LPDKTFEMTMLFDFFGDLLTEKQREYFDLYHNEDLSLSEIAENNKITRQGVRDIIVRAEATLREAETKTGIIKKFSELQSDIDTAIKYANQLAAVSDTSESAALAEKLIAVLDKMKG